MSRYTASLATVLLYINQLIAQLQNLKVRTPTLESAKTGLSIVMQHWALYYGPSDRMDATEM